MPKYIKSHSNYRLTTRHQIVNNGAILERDISTVGGVDSFATGQSTIYASGNFVLVINNDSHASRHVVKKGWLAAGDGSSGDTWTAETLREQTSDVFGSVEKNILIKNDFMDFRSFAYHGSLADLVENTVTGILTYFPFEIYSTTDNPEPVTYITSGTYYEVSNPGNIDLHSLHYEGITDNTTLGHFCDGGVNNYSVFVDNDSKTPPDGYSGLTWECEYVSELTENKRGEICPIPGVNFAKITLGWGKGSLDLYAFWDNNLQVKYLTQGSVVENIHFRPKPSLSFYDDFMDNLDLFGKCLMGQYSGIRYSAKFEVVNETETGPEKHLETFTFPVGPGGYNLGSEGLEMAKYVRNLGDIGLRYDEQYTDNLYRMMTHDSIKNLDWTSNFNGDNGSDEGNHYIKTGEKMKSVIRIMGYVFDQQKNIADAISNVNTITYSNRSNLSDYYLTDSLETDGWVVNNIYPYELKQYNKDGYESTDFSDSNEYKRKFSEITTEVIKPYNYLDGAYYSNGSSDINSVPGYTEGQEYVVIDYPSDKKIVKNVITNFHDYVTEFTVPEVNNEFMKRLRINSRQIFRKKGTIEGIESVLSLFGMKSSRWVEERNSVETPDFDIKEYTASAEPIEDKWDDSHNNYRIDWFNSCKTIAYPTASYANGEYIPYQGLPVAYKDIDEETSQTDWDGNPVKKRLLYPYFNGNGVYDGNMYYQMNGGWLSFYPYSYNSYDEVVKDSDHDINRETLRNVMQVRNVTELLSQPPSDLYENIVYYVLDTSENLAVINGFIYPLIPDSSGGEEIKYYFEARIYGGSVSIGGDSYTGILTVSGVDGSNVDYQLPLYADGTAVRIYYTGGENVFTLYSMPLEDEGEAVSPLTKAVFMNGSLEGEEKDYTHYFVLRDVLESDRLGEDYWQQLKDSDKEYQRFNNITDNFTGNNPHSGGLSYDNGEEYLDRYKKLFKYASHNELFNERCFSNKEVAYNEIDSYGFDVELRLNSDADDTKVHAFTDVVNPDDSVTEYEGDEDLKTINTKIIDLTFFTKKGAGYGKEAQEEIKYIQSKVLPYVEQMISSTLIVRVNFR